MTGLAFRLGRRKETVDQFHTMDDCSASVFSADTLALAALQKRESPKRQTPAHSIAEESECQEGDGGAAASLHHTSHTPKVGLKQRFATLRGYATGIGQQKKSPVSVIPENEEVEQKEQETQSPQRPRLLAAPSMTSLDDMATCTVGETATRHRSSPRTKQRRGGKRADFHRKKRDSNGTDSTEEEVESDNDIDTKLANKQSASAQNQGEPLIRPSMQSCGASAKSLDSSMTTRQANNRSNRSLRSLESEENGSRINDASALRVSSDDDDPSESSNAEIELELGGEVFIYQLKKVEKKINANAENKIRGFDLKPSRHSSAQHAESNAESVHISKHISTDPTGEKIEFTVQRPNLKSDRARKVDEHLSKLLQKRVITSSESSSRSVVSLHDKEHASSSVSRTSSFKLKVDKDAQGNAQTIKLDVPKTPVRLNHRMRGTSSACPTKRSPTRSTHRQSAPEEPVTPAMSRVRSSRSKSPHSSKSPRTPKSHSRSVSPQATPRTPKNALDKREHSVERLMHMLEDMSPSQIQQIGDKKLKISFRLPVEDISPRQAKLVGFKNIAGCEDPFDVKKSVRTPLSISHSREGLGRVEQLKLEMAEKVRQIRERKQKLKTKSPRTKNEVEADNVPSTPRRTPRRARVSSSFAGPQLQTSASRKVAKRNVAAMSDEKNSNTLKAILSPRETKRSVTSSGRSESFKDIRQSHSAVAAPRKTLSLRNLSPKKVPVKRPFAQPDRNSPTQVMNAPSATGTDTRVVQDAVRFEEEHPRLPASGQELYPAQCDMDSDSSMDNEYDDEIIKIKPETNHLVAAQLQIPGLDCSDTMMGVQYEDVAAVYDF